MAFLSSLFFFFFFFFKAPPYRSTGTIVVTLTSVGMGMGYTLKFYIKVLYVICKAVSGELSCMQTGVVVIGGVGAEGGKTAKAVQL